MDKKKRQRRKRKVFKSKITYLEVNWTNEKGSVNQELNLEKEGQQYQVLVKVDEIKKGWFKDEVIKSPKIEPLDKEFYIPKEPEQWKTSFLGTGREGFNEVRSKQWRAKGFLLIGFLLTATVIIFVISRNYKKWKRRVLKVS